MDYGHATHLATNADTVCMAHQGGLHRVVINTIGGAGNFLTLYDSAALAAGPVLAVIDTASLGLRDLAYGVQVQFGIVAHLAGGTPADITVVTD